MKKRWLDIPSLSQINSANFEKSKLWCGRTSSSMIYNYYQMVAGNGNQVIVNSVEHKNLVYSDGSVAADKYMLSEPLERAKKNWNATPLQLYPKNKRVQSLTTRLIAEILHPVIESININNPVQVYTGISNHPTLPRHIVVISGYRIEDDGSIWLLFDDPATMSDTETPGEKSDHIGSNFLQIIDPGKSRVRGARYWIKASRLFEENKHSSVQGDLYCDHNDTPGFAVRINKTRTPDSTYAHYEEKNGFSLPQLVRGVEQLTATPADITNYYSHTEKEFAGGYFPIGGNTTWHGGLHILGKDGDTVHAVADGVVVYARMPVKDSKQDSLEYGSRNFVLIRHGNDEQVWYSLYYHLKSVEVDSDDAKKIVWLSRDKLKFSSGSYQRQMPTKEDNIPIHTFLDGEIALILHKEKAPWYYVQRGDVNCAENRGYVYFDSARMEEVAGNAEQLDSDAVIELNFPVKAGDVIGILGEGITREDNKIVKKPILHWSIVSPQVMPGFTETVDDANDDFTCDNEKIVQLVEKSLYGEDEVFKGNGKLSSSEIEEFFKDEERAKKLRAVACKFRSEWSIKWPEQTKIFCQFGLAGKTDILSLYNFWDDVSKNENNKLPANGHVWHYNPITFLHRMLFNASRANISDDMFEANKAFLLPKKAISILSGIGKFQSGNMIKDTILIGHKGVNGDTVDVVELSKKRAESVSAVLMLNKDRLKKFIEDNDWGDRERKIMLSWFKKADGKPYYAGSIDEDNAATLKAAVEAFQVANGLYKDGNAGKNTFTKMYELIHKMAGIKKFDKVETRAAGEVHAEAKAKPESCIVEAHFWTSVMAPSLDQYDSEADHTYKEWNDCVRNEILPAKEAEQVVEVKKYYEDSTLNLHYVNGQDCSIDVNGASSGRHKQNAPYDFVTQLQKDLIVLGYLPEKSYTSKKANDDGYFGNGTKRTVMRFQNHAKRLYRMKKDGVFSDIVEKDVFAGRSDGVCDYATAKEIRKWVDNSWVLPLGRFKVKQLKLSSGVSIKLREDVADAWLAIVEKVAALGGVLDAPYGDSLRPLSVRGSSGSSIRSFHYAGRAADLNQGLADPGTQKRYYLEKDGFKDGDPNRPFWRLYCKTEMLPNADGTIVEFDKGDVTCVNLSSPDQTYKIPKGNYIDLTKLITSDAVFERISAHNNWEGKVWKRAEWWHFQYAINKEQTWLDEMEAIGVSEAALVKAGWGLDEMDKPPG